MFIRFVTNELDENSNHRSGLFQAAYDLLENSSTDTDVSLQIQDVIDWFNEHLNEPEKLTKRKTVSAINVALSWFKDNAKEHILKARELAYLVESCGVIVETIHESRVGYITYEDEYQIVAIPFNDTKT